MYYAVTLRSPWPSTGMALHNHLAIWSPLQRWVYDWLTASDLIDRLSGVDEALLLNTGFADVRLFGSYGLDAGHIRVPITSLWARYYIRYGFSWLPPRTPEMTDAEYRMIVVYSNLRRSSWEILER